MIHNVILEKVLQELTAALIDNVPVSDPSRAGIVKIGPLQGDPDPDVARISVTLHENDPDLFYGTDTTGVERDWDDRIVETEIGGSVTYSRRFTVKARCLFDTTGEDLATARQIASTVRSRIETTLRSINFSGVSSGNETVVRGIYGDMDGEMVQAGGPPDAFDFHIKVRFDVLTNTGV